MLNAANEVAVDAFLHDGCSFTDIDRIVESCMDAHDMQAVDSFAVSYTHLDVYKRQRHGRAVLAVAL